ncbi:MAG TPA: site-specific integrase [Pseudoxanthomonas sp.]
MPVLADTAIRAAIRAGNLRTLSDGGSRGQGRLVLVVRPMGAHVAAEWYAQSWRRGRRAMAKIGNYPDLSLADARLKFAREYAGQNVARPKRKDGTLGDLFDGYVASLRARGAVSADDVKAKLDDAAEILGADTPASAITAADVVEYLRPIYERGARSMADHVRGYIRSAYGWGIASERDYRVSTSARFHLSANPAEGIPTEPKVAGTRWLDKDEFVKVWRWLDDPGTPITPHYLTAIQLLMATGQRVIEITSLRAGQYEPDERLLTWATTKNGRPHALPLSNVAVRLLESLKPNEHGLYFPSAQDPTKPVSNEVLYCCFYRMRARLPVKGFNVRDLRRTWKTLAGEAGLSKEVRDLLQNHGRWDVSTKHYDRWDRMPEKREAIALWSAWLDALLQPKVRDIRHAARSSRRAA